MKAHLGMTGSGFSRSAITRSTLCLSIATALALPVAIPAITPSTAVEQTAEKGLCFLQWHDLRACCR